METKYIKIPFELTIAKDIMNEEVDGKILTRDGKSVRILCFDAKGDNPIIALITDGEVEEVNAYPSDGKICIDNNTSSMDLMIEVPMHMILKDGDIITCGKEENGKKFKWVSIFKRLYDDIHIIDYDDYATLTIEGAQYGEETLFFDNVIDAAEWVRCPKEGEKHRLIDALKESKEPKAKEYLKLFFNIVMDDKYKKFEFKQDVLVRQHDEDIWCGAQFSHKELDRYVVFGGIHYEQCIPYNEETAHLLGTKNNI